MKGKVIIAHQSFAAQVENLRRISYHHSAGFTIKDEAVFESYCQWGTKDSKGLVLAAMTERGEFVSSLRANVYFSAKELEMNNIIFSGYSSNFVEYPVLDMSFAATSPDYFDTGLLSALRYYMYLMHKHCVKTITGVAVKDSYIYKTLHKLGYAFKDISAKAIGAVPNNTWVIAKLDVSKVDEALKYLKDTNKEVINNFPLIIT